MNKKVFIVAKKSFAPLDTHLFWPTILQWLIQDFPLGQVQLSKGVWQLIIFTARKRSLGQVKIFHQSVNLFTGGSTWAGSPLAGTHPPGRYTTPR